MTPPHPGPCYACGRRPSPRRIGGTEFLVCSRCGMGAIPRPGGDADYWDRGGDPEQSLADDYWTSARAPVFRSVLTLLDRELGVGRLIDVGGGVGYFAACALAAGWDAFSLDVSPLAAQAAAARLGPARSWSAVPSEAVGTFDAATLWCVIAHVTDPRKVITESLNLLRPGGRLFLSTPNFLFQRPYASALAKAGRPVDFVALEHFLHFSPASLDRVLDDCGATAWEYRYVGVTDSCGFNRGLTRWVVPAKRAWNLAAAALARVGPRLTSELQVLATK